MRQPANTSQPISNPWNRRPAARITDSIACEIEIDPIMRVSWPVVICSFAAGVVAGLLMAPKAGHETRRELASKARARLHSVEEQLRQLDVHLQHLEQQLKVLGERFRKAGEAASWQLQRQDIAQELPRMPHG